MSENVGQVWELASPDSTRGRANWDEAMHFIPKPCPLKPKEHQGVGSKRSDPLGVLLTEYPVQELTWTWYSELLVRDDVKLAIEQEGFTGLEFHPVRARMKLRSDEKRTGKDNRGYEPAEAATMTIPRLWELKVTGWGGMAPPEFGAHLEEYCPGCGYRKYRGNFNPSKLFDPAQWDGSDFFMIWPLPNFIFIVDRVAKFIESNIYVRKNLISIESVKFITNKLCPGSLRSKFPDDRAHQLGDPLGIY